MPINTSGPVMGVAQSLLTKTIGQSTKLGAAEAKSSAEQSLADAQLKREISNIANKGTKEGRAAVRAAESRHAEETIRIQQERRNYNKRLTEAFGLTGKETPYERYKKMGLVD